MSRPYVGGAKRASAELLAQLPHISDHVDRSVLTERPAAWADQDPSGKRYPMDLNYDLGNCVAAWYAHGIESQSRREGPPYKDNIIPAAAVGTAYWAECSKQAGSPVPQVAPGPGLDPVQAVIDWAPGFPTAGENLIAGACQISNLTDVELLKWCAWTFRGFGLAVELGDDWQQTWEAPGLWQVGGAPDPENGHMLFVGGYNEADHWLDYTWGTDKWTVPEWLPTYGQYAIVVLPAWWATVPGVNVTTLTTELEGFGGSPLLAA